MAVFKKHKKGKKEEDELLTKLHRAESAHHVVKYLDRDMHPDQADGNGDSPIHYYIKRKEKHNFECLMALLIHSNCVIDLVNGDGMTALHLACERNDLPSTKALVAFDANLNLINYENCTPLDIVTTKCLPSSEIPTLLSDLGGTFAKEIKALQRLESEDYSGDEQEGAYLSNPMESYFESDEPQDVVHQTVRTRFGLDSQLMSLRLNMDDPPSNDLTPALYYGGGLEFHDGREDNKEALSDQQPFSLPLESVPEAVDTPENSVVSGTSVLRQNNAFLYPTGLTPSPNSPASPQLEDSTEEDKPHQSNPEDLQERLAEAYSVLYPPKISKNVTESTYQPVTNPMSLPEEDDDDWVKVNGHSKSPHVHFAESSPSPPKAAERHLSSYTMMSGSIYKEFERRTSDKLDEAVETSLTDEDEGYAAWLQWREIQRAKKRREELRKELSIDDVDEPSTESAGVKKTTYTSPPSILKTSHEAQPHEAQAPPPKPPTVRRQTSYKRGYHSRRKIYMHHHGSAGSMNMTKSLVNPRVNVLQSMLGSSVSPFLMREDKGKGEKILCLDGGGIKGLIQIEVLKHLESLTGKKVTDLFDWIVGTSTGGILALGLVYGECSLDDLKKMFFELKDKVFKKQSGYIPTPCDTDALEDILKKTLGTNLKMKDVTKPKVMIAAVEKSTTELPLVFFNNCLDNGRSNDLVWKVGRYASAAPIYFKELDNFVDAGVVANNPCQYAMAAIQDHLRKQKSPSTLAVKKKSKPSIACVLSIGCGLFKADPIGDTDIMDALKVRKIFTAPQKLIHLLTLLLSTLSKSEDVAMLCQSNCEAQEIPFYRFNPKLGESVGTAETDNIKLCDLVIGAKKLVVESEEHISNLIDHLGCGEGLEI